MMKKEKKAKRKEAVDRAFSDVIRTICICVIICFMLNLLMSLISRVRAAPAPVSPAPAIGYGLTTVVDVTTSSRDRNLSIPETVVETTVE